MNISEINQQLESMVSVLTERQKETPSLAFPGEDAKTRKGAFKVSKVALDLYKKEFGFNPEDTLFKKQRAYILGIPRQDLPKVFDSDNMPDAQDFIAGKPKKAFQTWLKNVDKIYPKFKNALRGRPELIPLWFYMFMMRVSGRDMADIIFKKYFLSEPEWAFKSKKWREKKGK